MLDGPPFVLRLMLTAFVGAATILLALARPHKRTVEDWLLTILYYHVPSAVSTKPLPATTSNAIRSLQDPHLFLTNREILAHSYKNANWQPGLGMHDYLRPKQAWELPTQ